MTPPHSDIVILGAGLTGLTLAYRLRNTGLSVLLLEARDRTGGRIHTLDPPEGPTLEMGATWLGRKHSALWRLLEELKIPVFEQRQDRRAIFEAGPHLPLQELELPASAEPSYRIEGGSATLIRALADALTPERIRHDQRVHALKQLPQGVEVVTDKEVFTAGTVVSTLPPDLLLRTVAFAPALDDNLIELAGTTDTWMGKSIKVALTYSSPFWRESGRSATFFSNSGPVTELYDHGDAADSAFALKGFLHPALRRLDGASRRQRVIGQLSRYYGSAVSNYTGYYESVWADDAYTTDPGSADLLPHQRQGHPLFRQPRWAGRLHLAGTETAAAFPGYMEGAVRSGEFVAEWLRKRLVS